MGVVEIVLRCSAGVGLLLSNAFFVAAEFALTRIPQFDEEEFQESRGLRRAWEMTETLEIYLTACQVGITVTSILLGVIFEPGVSAIVHPIAGATGIPVLESTAFAVFFSVVLIQLAHTVWGEQSPTYLGVERPKTVASYTAIPVYWWATIAYPVIWVGDHFAKWTLRMVGVEIERSWKAEPEPVDSRADLRRQMGELLGKGRLPREQRQEVMNALEIVDTPVRGIMVEREDITALSTARSPEDNFKTMSETRRVRYPLVGETIDDFLGIIYAPAILPVMDEIRNGDRTYEEVAVEPMSVQPDRSVSEVIDEFQNQHQELALVREEGRTLGLVTATDAFEEVTGELEDPFD